MNHFSQQNSPLQVFTALEEDTLLPVRLAGHESLNGTYEFTLDLLAPRGAEVPFEKLLGQEAGARVTLVDGSTRRINGIVWSARQSDSDEVFDRYRLVLKPRLAQLGLVKRSRIFQRKTAVEILKELLGPVGGAEFHIQGKPPIRVYCTQYNETDLEFFLRLCSEEGFSHHWRHGRKDGPPQEHHPREHLAHTLIVTDNTTLAHAGHTRVEYLRDEGGTAQKAGIRSWETEQSLTPTKARVLDSHFQFYGRILETDAQSQELVRAGERELRTVPAKGPWVARELSAARQFDAVGTTGASDQESLSLLDDAQEHLARLAAAGMASASVRATARGDCNQVTAGHGFHLTGHPREDGEWLAVRVEHLVEVEGRYWVGETPAIRREAIIEAAPFSLPQPPWPPRPKPAVQGVETAMVTGPRGMDTFVDPYGRVKVCFWFDPSQPRNSASSCWVRVAQGWAGKGYGAAFWPRVGHEVVVSFERGDPDRPIITGSVYNGTNHPPFDLPANVYLSGFKTLCQGGDVSENYHLLLLSDERGAEVVHIHAEARFNSTQESSQVTMRPKTDINIQG